MDGFFNKFNQGKSDFVTAGMQLKYIADHKPYSTAIIHIDKKENASLITWRELFIQSKKLSWMLKEKGIKPGAVVMVAWPNSIEHIIAAFAIWMVGGCYLPISHKTANKELLEISNMTSIDIAFAEFEVPQVPLTINAKTMYKGMEEQPEDMPEDIKSNPNMISFSGGTSGKPKLIRQNMPAGISDDIFNIWFHISGMDFEHRQLLVGPLFHGAPHTAAFNGLFSGNTLVMPRNLCPDNIVKLIKEYKIQYIQMAPIMLNRIIKIPCLQKDDFASIEAMNHTSGFCSNWLKKKWMELLAPEKVYEIYSMTEVAGLTSIRGDEWLKHPGSVGLPVGEGQISIRDEDGNELPACELGEIYMTPPDKSFVTEYVKRGKMKASADGFLSVGDFGYMDEDGYLYFVDRRNDMIVTGGENVFVTEVETALLRHKKILDVAVVGIPDEEWGRRIHAIIESTTVISEQELRTFLRHYLSPYKIPKTFELVKSLKRGNSGKIDRERILCESISRGV